MTSRDHDFPPGDDISRDAPELDILRDAFAALPTPDATPTLDASDRETQAAVGWMADAFAALPVPEAVIPGSSRPGADRHLPPLGPRALPPRVPTPRLPTPWLRHAAAAAVFAALGLALWWARGAEQAVRTPDHDAPLVAVNDSSPPSPGNDSPTAPPIPDPIPGFREASPGSAGLVAVTTEHLEVSSGPVRLVLMTTGPLARGPSQNLP